MQLTQPEPTMHSHPGLCDKMDPNIRIVALVGPSNSGKTRMMIDLFRVEPRLRRMISVTTRAERANDPPGHYEFVAPDEFERMKQQRLFLWTTCVHGNWYGTMRRSVIEARKATWPTVMDLEPKCVAPLFEAVGSTVCLVFISCPSDQLERRIRERDQGMPDSYYQERIVDCLNWEKEARESKLPYNFISNQDGQFEQAFVKLRQILCRET